MTEKIVRRHLRRIWFHWYRLQAALTDAHNADVIKYPDSMPNGTATCCHHSWELRKSIEKWTADQISTSVQSAIRSEVLS